MPNKLLSFESISEIEKGMQEFQKDFQNVLISDTVKRILEASIPITDVENEKINDEHLEELNDMIGKTARDLTNDAIRGRLIKTEFTEYEQPTNFLDSVSTTVEQLTKKEALQRSEWFKQQILNGKIPDITESYETFMNKLKRLYSSKSFSTEDLNTLAKLELESAKSFEEEQIIDQIKESVQSEVENAQIRQNYITEVMQEVQDTKKEYDEQLEEKTSDDNIDSLDIDTETDSNPDDPASTGDLDSMTDPDNGSDGESNENIDGSNINGKKRTSDADKLANKIKQGKENADSQNTDLDDGSNGEADEGVGAMSTYQNRSNFGSTTSIGVGNSDDLYQGPLDNDGKSILDDNNDTSSDFDKDNTKLNIETNDDDKDAKSVVEEDFINPVRGTEDNDDNNSSVSSEVQDEKNEIPAKAVEALDIVQKLLPLSISNLSRVKVFSSEAFKRYLFKLDSIRADFIFAMESRFQQVEHLVYNSNLNLEVQTALLDKIKLAKEEFDKGKDKVIGLDRQMVEFGINSRHITSKESLFATSLAKNIINRSQFMRNRKKVLKRIIKDNKEYNNSVESVVDRIFNYTFYKNRVQYAKDISKAQEALLEMENEINGAIYHLSDQDKSNALQLKNLLGEGNFQNLFIANDLKLDFDNIFHRVKVETDATPANLLSDTEFTKKVLDNLENRKLEIEKTLGPNSLEQLVHKIIENKVDVTMENAPLFTHIVNTLGTKVIQTKQKALKESGYSIENADLTQDDKIRIYLKSKAYLSVIKATEVLGISNQEFKESIEKTFKYPLPIY